MIFHYKHPLVKKGSGDATNVEERSHYLMYLSLIRILDFSRLS